MSMKISGNQTAIAEILFLLDSKFIPPFVCHCNRSKCQTNTHVLTCEYQSKEREEIYGPHYYIYEVDYNGVRINSAKLLYHSYPDGNLLNGNVR